MPDKEPEMVTKTKIRNSGQRQLTVGCVAVVKINLMPA